MKAQPSTQTDYYQILQKEVNTVTQNTDTAQKINDLLQALCGNNIQGVNITKRDRDVEVEVSLTKSRYKHLEDTNLYVPKTLRFDICEEGLYFSSDSGEDAPYMDNSYYSGILKTRLVWVDVCVKNNALRIQSYRCFGLFFPSFGGWSNAYHILTEKLVKAISQD